MPQYDYLVVGAGLFGSVFARRMTDAGRSCLVIDKRDHIGGNCFTRNRRGIDEHRYGPHIFHTKSRRIWDFARRYAVGIISFHRDHRGPRDRRGRRGFAIALELVFPAAATALRALAFAVKLFAQCDQDNYRAGCCVNRILSVLW